jgi:hypothetical protein
MPILVILFFSFFFQYSFAQIYCEDFQVVVPELKPFQNILLENYYRSNAKDLEYFHKLDAKAKRAEWLSAVRDSINILKDRQVNLQSYHSNLSTKRLEEYTNQLAQVSVNGKILSIHARLGEGGQGEVFLVTDQVNRLMVFKRYFNSEMLQEHLSIFEELQRLGIGTPEIIDYDRDHLVMSYSIGLSEADIKAYSIENKDKAILAAFQILHENYLMSLESRWDTLFKSKIALGKIEAYSSGKMFFNPNGKNVLLNPFADRFWESFVIIDPS